MIGLDTSLMFKYPPTPKSTIEIICCSVAGLLFFEEMVDPRMLE